MVFIEAHRKQLLLAGSLAAAVTVFTVTACGGGGAAAPAQGAVPSQWTQAEVSQFTAAAGSGGSTSQESCVIGYFERDMSFTNAMAITSVDPASGPSMSAAQVKAALVSKYGTADGDAINAQFEHVVTDSNNKCDGSAAGPGTGGVHGTGGSPGTDSRPGRDVGVIVHRGLRKPDRQRGERMAGAGPRGAPERAAGSR